MSHYVLMEIASIILGIVSRPMEISHCEWFFIECFITIVLRITKATGIAWVWVSSKKITHLPAKHKDKIWSIPWINITVTIDSPYIIANGPGRVYIFDNDRQKNLIVVFFYLLSIRSHMGPVFNIKSVFQVLGFPFSFYIEVVLTYSIRIIMELFMPLIQVRARLSLLKWHHRMISRFNLQDHLNR